jgi:predicted TIM-barrel fold metal-dependent hydrolase
MEFARMKYLLVFGSIFVLLGTTYSQADDVLPPEYNFDRYSKMVDKSPFAVATAVAAPAATPDFAKDLYIANAARSQDGDMVTIASTADHNFKKYLTTREPVDGFSIANIEWSDKVGGTKVTISKDGNFATLTFNQALLSQSAANAGAMARAFTAPAAPVPNHAGLPNPHAPKLPPNAPPELQQLIPSRDSMQPRTRGLIQRNPRTSRAGGTDAPARQ